MNTRLLVAITLAAACATGAGASDNKKSEGYGAWEFNCPMLKVSQSGKTIRARHPALNSSLSFGFIGGVNQAEGLSLDMGRSFELEWGNIVSSRVRVSRRGYLRIGAGLDWRNYKLTGHKMLSRAADGMVTLEDYPEGADPKFSRVHTFSVSVPLKYHHFLSRRAYIALGPELYITPHASLKTRYRGPEGKVKLRSNDIHHNQVSVGVGAELVIHHVGMYYKYNPFRVLDTEYGPKFSAMTAGLKVEL